MERDSRKLVKRLKDDGWIEVRIAGSHHTFKHPTKPALITVPHPKKDLPTGLGRRFYKDAGRRE